MTIQEEKDTRKDEWRKENRDQKVEEEHFNSKEREGLSSDEKIHHWVREEKSCEWGKDLLWTVPFYQLQWGELARPLFLFTLLRVLSIHNLPLFPFLLISLSVLFCLFCSFSFFSILSLSFPFIVLSKSVKSLDKEEVEEKAPHPRRGQRDLPNQLFGLFCSAKVFHLFDMSSW